VGEAVSYPSVPATAAPKATIAMLRNAPWEWIWIGSSLILIAVILAAAFWGGGGGSDYTATQTAEALALLPTPAPTIYIIKALTILPSETPTAVPSDIPTSFPSTTPTLVPTNTPTPIKLLSRIVDDFGVSMALVPAGEFLMGSAENDRFAGNDEKPQHRVCLDAYYINVYEVTNVLYEACVQAGVCTLPGESKSNTRSRYYSNPTYDNFPVIYVDWNQAQAYCQWRGSDLPSEAQWEKAARGGLEGKKYPWGDEAPDCSWVNFDWDMGNADAYCVDDTNVVGSYSPNGYGLYDMAGNVWEWVQDLYEVTFYSSSPYKNPTGPSLGEDRVLRGGSWWGSAGALRVAFRTSCPPSKRIDVLGFRCARSPRDGITEALKRVIPLMVQMAGACVEGSAVSYFAVVQ
jgi:formylglycine-generating enzyme required for sulfatase activity